MRMDGRVVSAAMPTGSAPSARAMRLARQRWYSLVTMPDTVRRVVPPRAEDGERIFQILARGARPILLHDARAVDAVRRQIVGHGPGLRDVLTLALTAGDDGQRVRVRAQIVQRSVEPVAH